MSEFVGSSQNIDWSKNLLVSVVVNNYNYGRFLRQAIDSALSQTLAQTEVIVVDDGSTDDSREFIAGYGERIIAILKENGGQASALNAGWLASKGDVVIFLDADDFLFPHAAQRVVSVWRPGLAKVQYRVQLIGPRGETLPHTIPRQTERMPSGDLRHALLGKGSHPGPPTSGNAFARWVLESMLPMPESEYRLCADGYLFTLAPLYGNVVSLEEPLAAYRLHGANRWSCYSLDPERLGAYVKHDLQKLELLASRAVSLGYDVPENLALRDSSVLVHRLASLRLAPDRHPVKTDRPLQVAYWGIRTLWRWSGKPWWICSISSLWFVLASLLPRRWVRSMFAWAVFPEERPRLLRMLAQSS